MENLQTIIKNIGQAKHVAIVLPESASVDVFCSAIALQAALPSAMIFCTTPVPELPFLHNMPTVAHGLSDSNKLAIKVSNQNATPKELSYQKSDSGLTIYITPESGQFTGKDVSVLPSAGNFDLVIIIGASNVEQLGKLYTENTKLFFETPHINIDNSPTNEFYATVNFVVTTSNSLSEIIMDVIESLPGGLKNDAVSTALLAGIISQTSSFRDPKTTPAALQKASRLVASGARQQEIIQHLFKTKPLPLLQLWGRALARITAQPEKQLLTAVVTASDLEKTKMALSSLPDVLRDIIEMISDYSLVAFLAEIPEGKGVQVLLAGLPFEKLTSLAKQLTGAVSTATPLIGKYQYVSIHVDGSLGDIQAKLNQILENRDSVV